jgi:hypothetical protein
MIKMNDSSTPIRAGVAGFPPASPSRSIFFYDDLLQSNIWEWRGQGIPPPSYFFLMGRNGERALKKGISPYSILGSRLVRFQRTPPSVRLRGDMRYETLCRSRNGNSSWS